MERRRRMIGPVLARTGMILAMSLAAASVLAANPAPRVPGGPVSSPDTGIQTYKGKLVDESGKPISGIFPMKFSLYAGVKSRKAVWAETLWVAVDRGVYTVHLGAEKPLPSRSDLDRLVLGVDVRGVGELVREPFVPAELRPPVLTAGASHGGPPPMPGAPAPASPSRAGSAGAAKYADTAGYAVEADHAKNSDRLMNLTVDEVVRRAAEEAGGGGAGAAGGKSRVGAAKRYGGRVGGTGGTSEYNESCPKGFVVTGIRGGAGNFVDSIQLICSPIE